MSQLNQLILYLLEAMTAVGANKVQWIVYGVIPQVKAHFVSYVLYTFEVNVRAPCCFRFSRSRWYWTIL